MSPRLLLVLTVAWAFAALAEPANAQPAASTAVLSADVRSLAKLYVSYATVAFPDADPDVIPLVPAVGGALSITAKARATAGSQVILTIQAADDLRSGLNVIGAQAITWTAAGPGFSAGTLSKTSAVRVASWAGSGVRTGTQTLYFANQWTYATGTYSATLLYTLTAP
jgi:hypothetical protein